MRKKLIGFTDRSFFFTLNRICVGTKLIISTPKGINFSHLTKCNLFYGNVPFDDENIINKFIDNNIFFVNYFPIVYLFLVLCKFFKHIRVNIGIYLAP